MADETKTKVTMIQDEAGNLKRVKIGDTEMAVLHGGPIPGNGCTNFTLTIENVDLDYARKPKPAA